MVKHNLFPSKEECDERNIDYRYYAEKQLSPKDKVQIAEVVWDLIIERVISPGGSQSTHGFPFVGLTSFGEAVLSETAPHHYDPDGYIQFLKEIVPNLDSIIEQYIFESLSCFQRRLFFASAVMVGAAAEKAILLLLEAIKNSEGDPERKKETEHLLEGARLPSIYNKIMETLAPLKRSGAIPYSIHQGCDEHLMSLFEMIRVQRNDAVHPTAGVVNRDKLFLSLQTFPVAVQLVYRLINWFESNVI